MKLSTTILAGGQCIQAGQNKALLQYNNRSFINRIVKELGGFSETLISTAVKGDYEDLGLPVVYDEHQDIGPMEGIYQALKHASEEYDCFCLNQCRPFVLSVHNCIWEVQDCEKPWLVSKLINEFIKEGCMICTN